MFVPWLRFRETREDEKEEAPQGNRSRFGVCIPPSHRTQLHTFPERPKTASALRPVWEREDLRPVVLPTVFTNVGYP